jgi:hypothetical protein
MTIRTNIELVAANQKTATVNPTRPGLIREGQKRNGQALSWWLSKDWNTRWAINCMFTPDQEWTGIDTSLPAVQDVIRLQNTNAGRHA